MVEHAGRMPSRDSTGEMGGQRTLSMTVRGEGHSAYGSGRKAPKRARDRMICDTEMLSSDMLGKQLSQPQASHTVR